MALGTLAYLFGLLAIVVPIVIHLWSKKIRKTIAFGTVRFLQENETQSIKSLVPTDWLLLLLRILIIACLVLILSEPLWKSHENQERLILVDPDYRDHPALTKLKDSLLQENAKWFAPRFPAFADSLEKVKTSHWQLLEKLQDYSNRDITILSPRRMSNYRGERTGQNHVSWASLPSNESVFEIGQFAGLGRQYLIKSHTNESETSFEHEFGENGQADSLLVTVNIEADASYLELDQFVRTSIAAINEDSPLRIKIVEESEADWLIWLKEEAPPLRRKVLFSSRAYSQEKIKEVSSEIFTISKFDVQEFLASNFPLQLENILGRELIPTEKYDWRMLPKSQLPGTTSSERSPEDLWISAGKWFWILLVILLLTERFISLKTVAE